MGKSFIEDAFRDPIADEESKAARKQHQAKSEQATGQVVNQIERAANNKVMADAFTSDKETGARMNNAYTAIATGSVLGSGGRDLSPIAPAASAGQGSSYGNNGMSL